MPGRDDFQRWRSPIDRGVLELPHASEAADGGEDWSCMFGSLPPIHCVKVAVV
jgi:hypothetical protein